VIQGLIVGHKDIGTGLLAALESISGPVAGLRFFSNSGLSTKELAAKITAYCVDDTCRVIIFADVYGGSCWRAAKMAGASHIRIVSGLNLPMLLSFVNKRDMVPFDELPAVLAEDGLRGIIVE